MALRMRNGLPLWLVLTSVLACTKSPNAGEPIEDTGLCDGRTDVSASVKSDVVEPGVGFSVAFYKRMARTEKGSFVFSPFGVRSTLALSAVGARGDTATELAESLRAKGGTTSKWHHSFSNVQAQVLCPQGERSRKIEFANGLFLQDGMDLKDSFVASLEKNYAATPHPADFKDDTADAKAAINDWINDQTQGKIANIVAPKTVTRKTKLLLVNGLSLSDRWSAPFDPAETRNEAFYLAPKQAKKTPMMHQLETLSFVKESGFQALLLPTERERTAMVVFLPTRVDGLAALETNMTAPVMKSTFKALRNRASQALVSVTMPKFRMTQFSNHTGVLMALGIQKPFLTGKANFTGIDGGNQKLFVSAAVQKTVVDVGEGGLESPVPETVEEVKTTAHPEPAATFRADHPFLFSILDSATGEILYMGRVMNPTLDGV